MGKYESPGLLAAKVAVVTGAARGIGLAIAQRFHEEDATVVIADVDYPMAQEEASRLQTGSNAHVVALALDVTSESSVDAAVQRVTRELGAIDIFVANAGVLSHREVLKTGLDEWNRVLAVNLTGIFLTCRAFARSMVANSTGGRIILTSSLFGVRGGAYNAAYSASKFGVVGFGQCLAAELARYRITVNSVCPGQVATSMMTTLLAERAATQLTDLESARQQMQSKIPLGRMGEPREIADVYVFLASDLAQYLTGQAIVVDGGWQVG